MASFITSVSSLERLMFSRAINAQSRRPLSCLQRCGKGLGVRGGGRYDQGGYYYESFDDDNADTEYRYDDYAYPPQQHAPAQETPPSPKAAQKNKNGAGLAFANGSNRKLGMGLVAGGSAITLLGITLMFNKSLIKLGNIMFVSGIPCLLGIARVSKFLTQPSKMRGSATLAAGFFLILIGWPIFGMLVEIFGLLNLFGNMFPLLWSMLKRLPFVSALLSESSPQDDRQPSGRDYY